MTTLPSTGTSNESLTEAYVDYDSLNEKAKDHEDLCKDFSFALGSLTADATALRQLASLRLTVGDAFSHIHSHSEDSIDSHINDENKNPNIGKYRDDESGKRGNNNIINGIDPNVEISAASKLIQKMRDIDDVVSTLEERMSIIKSVIEEEKRSVQQLEDTKCAAEEQLKLIEEIRKGCVGLRLPGQSIMAHSDALFHHNSNASTILGTQQNSAIQAGIRNRRQCNNQGKSLSEPKSKNKPNSLMISNKSIPIHLKSDHSLQSPPHINLEIVTESEFHSISRNIRGRITLGVLNDALADIERVAQMKYSILSRHGPSKGIASGNRVGKGTNTILRRHGAGYSKKSKQYRQTLALHRELSVDEHEGRPWVSEQDLRDSCAFFRCGESTARSILQILRTLNRLKQICGKHSQVTYVCLNCSKSQSCEPIFLWKTLKRLLNLNLSVNGSLKTISIMPFNAEYSCWEGYYVSGATVVDEFCVDVENGEYITLVEGMKNDYEKGLKFLTLGTSTGRITHSVLTRITNMVLEIDKALNLVLGVPWQALLV